MLVALIVFGGGAVFAQAPPQEGGRAEPDAAGDVEPTQATAGGLAAPAACEDAVQLPESAPQEGDGAGGAESQLDPDTDGDGLPDSVEDRDGDGRRGVYETSVHLADTDGDGTSDSLEIAVGTDPTRNGLLAFPEPMVFDLVRGLDAAAGELELNLLAQVRKTRAGTVVAYAPEIEVALADGFAAELELPFVGDRLEAVKAAVQLRVGSPTVDWAQGFQVIGEYALDGELDLTGLHIANLRLASRVPVVSLVGARLHIPGGSQAVQVVGVANVNVFYVVSQQVNLGLEANLLVARGETPELRLMPQVHVQLNHHARVQIGLGYVRSALGSSPEGATRVIVEL